MESEELKKWLNVPLVEKTLKARRKLGKWQANQTAKEKEHSLLSACTSAVERPSVTS